MSSTLTLVIDVHHTVNFLLSHLRDAFALSSVIHHFHSQVVSSSSTFFNYSDRDLRALVWIGVASNCLHLLQEIFDLNDTIIDLYIGVWVSSFTHNTLDAVFSKDVQI